MYGNTNHVLFRTLGAETGNHANATDGQGDFDFWASWHTRPWVANRLRVPISALALNEQSTTYICFEASRNIKRAVEERKSVEEYSQ